MRWFILLAMMFCHIVNDYNLQGWLATAKQREWWEKNAPDEKYRNDFLMALFEHSFSWAFMMELPVFGYALITGKPITLFMFALCIINTSLHATIDDMKANKKTINLVQDQAYHFIQIVLTWMFAVLYYGI